MLKSLGLQL